MERMMHSANRLKLDNILLSSPYQKQTPAKINDLKSSFKRVNDKISIITLDSSQTACTEKRYLPGSIASMLLGRLLGM